MAATSKLSVWNDALREVADHPLADTTTANTRQKALNDAWDHAVEYILAKRDWNFARRRAVVAGVADTSVPPFTYRYARPSDYLRKVSLKADWNDEFQLPHSEVAAVLYGFADSVDLEYMSDHADNYDPANWPPQFTRVLALHLAMLIAPKLGRAGTDDVKTWYEKVERALSEAEAAEAVTTINTTIAADRDPVMRRAIEILGQQLSGSSAVQSDVDYLRWQINKGWETAVKFVLEQAPWNFALRRATLTSTADTASFPPYTFRFDRPASFLKRVWVREVPTDAHEADYAEAGGYFYGYAGTKVLEYISADSTALTATNWPQSFSELVSLYLAMQIAPMGGGAVMGEDGKERRQGSPKQALQQQFTAQLEAARIAESSQHQTKSVPAARRPVMRRAMEIMGQQLSGFTVTNDTTSRMQWQMNLAWAHSVKSVLAQGAWNFATKRALLEDGATGDANVPTDSLSGLGEGYSVEPDSSTASTTDISGFEYSYPLPDDFVHKIWLKSSPTNDAECVHQFMGDYVFLNYDPAIMEYVAENSTTTDPANWPPLFLDAVAAHLALSVAPEMALEISGGKGGRVVATGLPARLEGAFNRLLGMAKNKDAIQQYPTQISPGRFVRARAGGYSRLH